MKLLAVLAVCVVGLVSADNFGQYVAKSFFKLDENGNPSPIRPIMANTLNRVRRQIQPFQPFGFAPLPFPNIQPGQGQGNFVSTSQVLSSRFGDDEPTVSGQTTVVHTNKDGKYQQTTTNLRPDGSTHTSHNSGRVKRQQSQLQSQGGPNGNQHQSQSQNQPGGQQIQSQTQGSDPTPIAGGNQQHAPTQGHSDNRIPQPEHPQQPPQQGHPQQGNPQQGNPQQGQNPSGYDPNTESRNPQDPGYQQGQQGQYPQQGQQGGYPQQGYQGQQGGYQGQPGGYQGQQGGYPQQPFGGSPFGLGAFGPAGFPQFGQPGFGAGPGFGGPGFGAQPGFGFGSPFGGFQQPAFGGGFPGGAPVGGPGSTFTANRVGLDSRFNDDDDKPNISGGTTSFTSNNGVFHSTSQVVGPDGKVTTHRQSGRL